MTDGSFHAVDSDALSFEVCAKMAYRNASKSASPVLLEPIMKMEVVTPEENMGDIVGDLNRRRGQVQGMDAKNNSQVIQVSTTFRNVWICYGIKNNDFRSSNITMEFSHYDEAPKNIADEVIKKANGDIIIYKSWHKKLELNYALTITTW